MKIYELTHQKNIRDIGGFITKDGRHIKYGRLYRGGALLKLDENDIKIIEGFHLTDVIDFRNADEFIVNPCYRPSGAKIHNIPVLKKDPDSKKRKEVKGADGNLLWFVGDHTSGLEHLIQVYSEFVSTDEGVNAYKEFFKIIMKEGSVCYFHCSQGKDRTGFAAYLLEIALGVDEEEAVEDYLLSNVAMTKRAEALLRQVEYKPFYNEQYKKDLIDVFSTKKEYLASAKEAMEMLYGGTIAFIQNALEVDIDRLKDMFLE